MRVDLKARPHKVSTFRNVYIYILATRVFLYNSPDCRDGTETGNTDKEKKTC